MSNRNKWSSNQILNFFKNNRNKYSHAYIGEKILINEFFKKKYSVLDIGCAQGGLINILKKINSNFNYCGLDYNLDMLSYAKKKFPNKKFIEIKNNYFFKYTKKKYDIVFVLGILHLNKEWKKIIKQAFKVTKKHLIFDLRETNLKNKKKLFQDLNMNNKENSVNKIRYYLLNKNNIKNFLSKSFKNKKIIKIEYDDFPSKFTNYKKIISFTNYCISK